jgi:hypothetical protein
LLIAPLGVDCKFAVPLIRKNFRNTAAIFWRCQVDTFSFLLLFFFLYHVMILGKWPTWRTFPFYVFIYIFNSLHVSSTMRQIVSIQPLVTVTLCWWPCRVQVGSSLPTCPRHGHRNRVTATRGCIATICLSWWWARCARNM